MEIQTTSEDRTWKEKVAAMPRNLKSRSLAKMNDARAAIASVKPRVNAMTMKANDSMRGNPSKWAGIAAGAARRGPGRAAHSPVGCAARRRCRTALPRVTPAAAVDPAVALKGGAAQPQAKVLSKPFHLKDLVNEVERLLAA